tara:strand:+ start:152 stop:400 length:249 start_codon:yes stop_codon:yes gene_type:complete
MGVKDRGQQRQHVGAAATPFDLVLVDVPAEVIVDVASPFHACPLRTERRGQGQKMFLEIALDQLSLLGGMDGARAPHPLLAN